MRIPKISPKLLKSENFKKGFSLGIKLLMANIKKIPIAVNYDLTWRCNLRCSHCYFYSSASELELGAINERKELTDEEWIKIFQYHRNLGVRSAALTGGEPTLRMDLLQKAVDIFPSVQIASNGTRKIPYFKGDHQPLIWISLDGNRDTHNKVRGAEIFDNVINNIRDDKRILISCTITSQNCREIEGAVQSAYEAGVSGVFFLWYTGYDNDPLLLTGESRRIANRNIIKVMEEYGDFVLISRKMLELYNTKEFINDCIFRSNQVFSFYPNGRQKFCVMGNSPELCKHCGCIVPVASYALGIFDVQTVDKLQKFKF
ncbi:MAG: radical SAM protein [Promethearchaeota archaeon]|nr:MAG: radical SAM protein [Candidatus Lokiarchaeota archaeon]